MTPDSQDTNEPYAWGRMGPGRRFHKIAADLDRAWSVCRLHHHERVVLQYVREHTWGVSAPRGCEPGPCNINLADLARRCGVPRQRLTEALASLVSDSLLLVGPDGYSIGKDVAAWKGGRISPEGMAYARDLADQGARPGVHVSSVQHARRSVHPLHAVACTPCTPGRAPSARPGVHPLPAPYRNAGASEDLEIEEDNNKSGDVVPRSIPATPEATAPAPREAPPAPPSPDKAEALRLRDWATARALAAVGDEKVGEDFGRAVAYWLQAHKPHVVAAFIQEALGVRLGEVSAHKLVGYVNGCLRRHKPGDAPPPIPAEWKPAPARPAHYDPGPRVIRDVEERYARLRAAAKEKISKPYRPDWIKGTGVAS